MDDFNAWSEKQLKSKIFVEDEKQFISTPSKNFKRKKTPTEAKKIVSNNNECRRKFNYYIRFIGNGSALELAVSWLYIYNNYSCVYCSSIRSIWPVKIELALLMVEWGALDFGQFQFNYTSGLPFSVSIPFCPLLHPPLHIPTHPRFIFCISLSLSQTLSVWLLYFEFMSIESSVTNFNFFLFHLTIYFFCHTREKIWKMFNF